MQAHADLFGVLQLAKLHVGTSEPEQRQVCNDAARIGLEKILQDRDGLIVAASVIEILSFSEHRLFGVTRNIVLLLRGCAHAGVCCQSRAEGRDEESRGERHRANFVLLYQGRKPPAGRGNSVDEIVRLKSIGNCKGLGHSRPQGVNLQRAASYALRMQK